jgi:hypothetical protein
MTDEPNIEAATQWTRTLIGITQGFSAARGHKLRALCMLTNAMARNRKPGDPIFDEGRAKSLIKESARDADAYLVVCKIIRALLEKGQPLPAYLRDFLFNVLDGKKARLKPTKGWDQSANYARNFYIQLLVCELVNYFGLNRTRNPATDRPSACSLVAEIFSELSAPLSEKTVAEITRDEQIHDLLRDQDARRTMVNGFLKG